MIRCVAVIVFASANATVRAALALIVLDPRVIWCRAQKGNGRDGAAFPTAATLPVALNRSPVYVQDAQKAVSAVSRPKFNNVVSFRHLLGEHGRPGAAVFLTTLVSVTKRVLTARARSHSVHRTFCHPIQWTSFATFLRVKFVQRQPQQPQAPPLPRRDTCP